MVEALKKLRELGAFMVLGALTLTVILALIRLFSYAVDVSFTNAAAAWSDLFVSPLGIVVLTLLVATCVLVPEPTKNARLLTLLSVIVVGVMVVLAFLTGVVGLVGGGVLNFFFLLVGLVIPVLAVLVLWKLFQGQPAPVRAAPQQALPPGGPYQPQYGQQQGGQQYPGQGPAGQYGQAPSYGQQQPTWQPDQAAGAGWTSAGAAASGASASGWGAPGEQGGWQPNQPIQPQPDQSQPVQPNQPIQPTQPVQPAAGQWNPGNYEQSVPLNVSPAAEDSADLTRIAEPQMEEYRRRDEERRRQEGAGQGEPEQQPGADDWWNRQS